MFRSTFHYESICISGLRLIQLIIQNCIFKVRFANLGHILYCLVIFLCLHISLFNLFQMFIQHLPVINCIIESVRRRFGMNFSRRTRSDINCSMQKLEWCAGNYGLIIYIAKTLFFSLSRIFFLDNRIYFLQSLFQIVSRMWSLFSMKIRLNK